MGRARVNHFFKKNKKNQDIFFPGERSIEIHKGGIDEERELIGILPLKKIIRMIYYS